MVLGSIYFYFLPVWKLMEVSMANKQTELGSGLLLRNKIGHC